MTITFQGGGARFRVRVWRLRGDEEGRLWTHAPNAESLRGDCGTECQLAIPRLHPSQSDRLAVIVVRLDPGEGRDPVGSYRLIMSSGVGGSDPRG
jgi:hypothetical protein